MSRKADVGELLEEVNEIESEIKAYYTRAKAGEKTTQIPRIKVKSALEHLRSILDYCALDIHEMYYDGKGKIYFPYGTNEALFKKHLKSHFKNLAGKATKVYELVKSVQSFNTERDWLVALCNTVNSNKHIKLSSQDKQVEKSVTIGSLGKVSGGGKIVIHGGTVNGIPIAKDPNVPVIITSTSSEEEIRKTINPGNPYLAISKETEKVEFILDESGWDALDLISEAKNGIEAMVAKLYVELTANK